MCSEHQQVEGQKILWVSGIDYPINVTKPSARSNQHSVHPSLGETSIQNHDISILVFTNQMIYNFHNVQEAGSPRQATGPPRSGAGVGVGMLRGRGTT